MTKVPVENLFKIDKEEILNLSSDIELVFFDGSVNTSAKKVIFFRWIMDFITQLDLTPKISISYYIDNNLTNGYFTLSTITSIYSKFLSDYKSIIRDNVISSNSNYMLERLLELFYISVNDINKRFSSLLSAYVFSVDVLDVLKLQFNPDILDSIKEVTINKTDESIDNSYKTVESVIYKLQYSNKLRIAYYGDMVKKGQFLQLVGSRGKLTDLDGSIYKYPVTNSFTLGLKNMYEIAIESRAAAKANLLSTKAIQQSEYLARNIQLITMPIRDIFYGDCGSTDYVEYPINKSNIKTFKGKWYYLDGKEHLFTGNETHLLGKVVKFRSVMNCKHPNKFTVCSKCLGEVSYNILDGQSIGHLLLTILTHLISQGLLSSKHLLSSAQAIIIALKQLQAKYFRIKNKNEVYLYQIPYLKNVNSTLRIYLKESELFSFRYLKTSKNLLGIVPETSSRITDIMLGLVKNGKEELIPISMTSYDKHNAKLSVDMWSYIINHDYELKDNWLVFDLKEFNISKPIFFYEKKEFSFAVLNTMFKSNLNQRKYFKENGRLVTEITPSALVTKVIDLLSKKMQVDASTIELLVYSLMIKDINTHNYDLSRNISHRSISNLNSVINNRSVSVVLGWQNLLKRVLDPKMYLESNRPNHQLDVLIRPNEALHDLELI